MKTILNIIIAVLIYLIYSDVEFNAHAKELDYSNTFVCLAGLLVFGFIRYYYVEFKELLMTKK